MAPLYHSVNDRDIDHPDLEEYIRAVARMAEIQKSTHGETMWVFKIACAIGKSEN